MAGGRDRGTRVRASRALASLLLVLAASTTTPSAAGRAPPPAVVTRDVPPVPDGLDESLNRYRFSGATASLEGWFAGRREILYLTEGPGGTAQAFVTAGGGGAPEQVTHFAEAVDWARPHPRLRRFAVGLDAGGDENHQVAIAYEKTGYTRRLTFGRARNGHPRWSPDGSRLALSSDARDGDDLDLYLVDPETPGSGRRLREAAGRCWVEDWAPDGRRLAALETNFAATSLLLIDVPGGRAEAVTPPPGRMSRLGKVRWSRDGGALFFVSDYESDVARLARLDLATKVMTPLTARIPWEIDEYDLADDGRTLAAVANEDGRWRLHVLDARDGRELPGPGAEAGRVAKPTFRPGSRELAYERGGAREPTGIVSFDLATGRRTTWVAPRRDPSRAARTEEPDLIHYRSFDGRQIPAFVSRPGRDLVGRKREGPRPVLIDIHGGPAAQYRPRYSALDECLKERYGIALVYPNVRGSTGYGRAYEALDDGPRREDAIKDIGALLDWIAAQPDLDASRVAIRGGSFGGTMTLAALIRYGDRLRAGIDVAGPSNLLTMLAAERPGPLIYWRHEVGDERDPKLAAFLTEISPLTHADRIRRPLLVAHGRNDPRVKLSEARQIADAVRANGVPVWTVEFPNEGHDIARRENSLYLQHVQLLFLAQYLCGEAPEAAGARAKGPPRR